MFQLKFSPVVIKHLGLSMYSTLPPVLAELITNSYDADASEVKITINQNHKSIEILDNGCGMNADELNNDFLHVGRNRREKNKNDITQKFKRYVTGKKGIGKLSVFGICTKIYVESCKNGKINAFEMDYNELINREDDQPLDLDPIINNQDSASASYTKIILKDLMRKTEIPVLDTANSILIRLNFFDKNFVCVIEDGQSRTMLTKEAREILIETDRQFAWNLPQDFKELNIDEETKKYFIDNQIKGRIITTKDTIREAFKGITLYARGKLANNPEFYGVKLSNSHAFSYMSGSIDVDYLDKERSEENISTARNSLIWENDEPRKLMSHLQHVIKKIGLKWRERRIDARTTELQLVHNIDTEWYQTTIQSGTDQKLAKKITDIVISSELEVSKTKNLIDYVKGAFEFQVFKEYAHELEENPDAGKLLQLLQDWEIIEAREQYRLAIGRIETIEKFEQLIHNDTLEVAKKSIDSMHHFLNKFPWILEPRLNSLTDEVTYKKFLKDEFNDDSDVDEDKRIDFICKGDRDTLFIMEIKRSQKMITKKELEQLEEYCDFIKATILERGTKSDRDKYKYVKGYIIGKALSQDTRTQVKLENMERNNMNFLSYEIMLEQAKQYHKEFMESYEKLNHLIKLN
ncbi:ATP-binding protein [Sulfurospirillum arsenophilum]|uniref:ATP-binding protein n=1 Tax=Sulfurospirillum arsenophilum TaxID=56698 RepID=UPI0005A8CBF8|nr:ATP-binding protein [Sulfurospirillum arsenophilum]